MSLRMLRPRQSDKPRVCRIVFKSSNSAMTQLGVLVEFQPQKAFTDERDARHSKILESTRSNRMIDRAAVQADMDYAVNVLLASRVKKVEGADPGSPVTVRDLAQMVWMNVDAIAEFGGYDAEVPMDPSDETPLTDEDRKRFGVAGHVKKKGQVAFDSILYLVENSAEFSDWLQSVAFDVSVFQDQVEDELKNLKTGAVSTPAPSGTTTAVEASTPAIAPPA